MPSPWRLLLLASLLGAWHTRANANELANWTRLQAMPRERRLALADSIKRFDALDHQERSAIRSLDSQIASRTPTEQARYRSILRRYHLWVDSLPEDQREQLRRARPGDERMALVSKLHRAEKAYADGQGASALSLRVIPVSPGSPTDTSRWLRTWLELTPKQRQDLEKMNLAPGQFAAQVRKAAGRLAAPKSKAGAGYAAADEESLIKSLEGDLNKARDLPALFKTQLEPAKGVDTEKAAAQAERFKKQLAENYYFFKYPPEKVSSDNLARFAASLPGWFRTTYDSLPADEARRRMTVLYRLVYPHPEEMPRAAPVAAAAKPAAKSEASKKRATPAAPAKTVAPRPPSGAPL